MQLTFSELTQMIKDGVLVIILSRIKFGLLINHQQTVVLGVCFFVIHFVSLLCPFELISIWTSLGTGSSGAVFVSHMWGASDVSNCTRVGNAQKRLAAKSHTIKRFEPALQW